MKITEWKLRFSENVSSKLKNINKLSNEAKMRMSNLQDRMNAAGSKLSKDTSALLSNLKDRTGSMVESITGMGGGLTSALTNPYVLAGAAALAFAGKSTQMAMNFETGMAKINATAQLPKEKLDDLRNKILEIGGNSAQNLQSLPDAFEKILSQTNDVNKSLDILKVATLGADAGFADLDTVAAGIAQSMNLVQKEGLSASQVLDTFMAAKRVGAGEFSDFAQYMPQLIAAGNNLGVSFNQTAGTFAYMTSMGQSAADSAMMMQNLYGILGRGEVQKNMKAIAGIDLFDAKGQMRNLDVIFSELAGKMAGMSDKQKSNLLENLGIKDMQAKSAFSVMITDAQKLQQTMKEVANSSGEAQRTFDMTANPIRNIGVMGNYFSKIMIKIGKEILPYVNQGLLWVFELVKGVVNRFRDAWAHASIFKDILWLAFQPIKFIFKFVGLIGKAFVWLYDNAIKPIVDAINWVYDKFKELLGFGDKAIVVKKEVSKDGTQASVTTTAGTGAPKTPALQTPGEAINGKAQKGIDGVSGGGSQVRNVIVNMNNTFNIRAGNLKESMTQVKEIAIRAMVEVAQGAELTVAN